MMIIHQSDMAELRYAVADSDLLLVFFGTMEEAAGNAASQGAELARKAGLAAISVLFRTSDCHLSQPIIEAVRTAAAPFRQVVAWGHGKGGWAALAAARQIGADTAIALAPGCDIAGPCSDPVGNSHVFAPRQDHRALAEIGLAEMGKGGRLWPMPADGFFASTPRFVALLDACRRGDASVIRSLITAWRRRAPGRLPSLAAAPQSRRPRLVGALAEHVVAAAEPRTAAQLPVVTVFGSCRVYNPCALLAADGAITLNQSNIFGFVHCAPEVLQQFSLITGETRPPSRLKRFLNIGPQWQSPESAGADALQARFAATDVFVVEISSVRLLRFKAFLLQINRTRELLAADPETLRDWWTPLLRTGKNHAHPDADKGLSDVAAELMPALTLTEQPVDAVARDIEEIARRLGKPVLFVSHFNTNMSGRPIVQRSAIIAAMAQARLAPSAAVFDPTGPVREAGIDAALFDTAHYQPAFERHIAGLLLLRILALRQSATAALAA